MKFMNKKGAAIDLSDLAIGIVVLGIVVSVGATVLINVRDTNTAGDVSYNVSEKAAIGLGEYGKKPNCPLKWQHFNALTRISVKAHEEMGQTEAFFNARETDKGFFFNERMIYSPNLAYK